MHNEQSEIQRRDGTVYETRNYYSCWPIPWGGWLCGVSLIVIGAGVFLQRLYPGTEELIWGGLLVGLGVVVLLSALRNGGEPGRS